MRPNELRYGSIADGYDRCMRPLERRIFEGLRRRLIPQATGATLEVGGGTGANLAFYSSDVRLTFTDPDPRMIDLARVKPLAAGLAVRFEVALAEDLPFDDACFDTAVITLALCSVCDPMKSLAEMRRTLRPGGRLLALEHVRPPKFPFGAAADALTPLQKRLAGGCHLNRRTLKTIEESGFALRRIERRAWGIVVAIEAECVN